MSLRRFPLKFHVSILHIQYVGEGYKSPSTTAKMADHNSTVTAPRNDSSNAANGDSNTHTSNVRSGNERGGRFEGRAGRGGRGGGSRGRGQGRGNRKGFGGNDRGGRHKKADMGRGEYKYVLFEYL